MPIHFKPVLVLRSESSTPVSIGGYDKKVQRKISTNREIVEDLRTQSLRGVFRWWTRAFLSGVLFQLGFNEKNLIEAVTKLSSNIWGGVQGTTWLQVNSFVNKIEKPYDWPFRLPRNLFRNVKGFILLNKAEWSPLEEDYVRLATLSVITSFLLGCFGKRSRKGLGCFDIHVIWSPMRDVLEITKKVFNSDSIQDLVRYTFNVAKHIVHKSYGNLESSSDLPPIPSISPGVFRIYRCHLNREPIFASNLFVSCMKDAAMKSRSHRRNWILGLPRRGEEGLKSRRPSPIIFSAHKGRGYISVFYSSDWPEQIDLDPANIREVMNEFVKDLLKCLRTHNLNCEGGDVF